MGNCHNKQTKLSTITPSKLKSCSFFLTYTRFTNTYNNTNDMCIIPTCKMRTLYARSNNTFSKENPSHEHILYVSSHSHHESKHQLTSSSPCSIDSRRASSSSTNAVNSVSSSMALTMLGSSIRSSSAMRSTPSLSLTATNRSGSTGV